MGCYFEGSNNLKSCSLPQKKNSTNYVNILTYIFYIFYLAILTSWVFKKKRFKFIHESGVSVILGLIIGAILRYTGPDHK